MLLKRGWGGIEPPTSRTLNENHTTRPPAQNINMENAGFDPAASTLRTSHSTDWANPPTVINSGFSGLVGYDDRLTRGRSRVRLSAEVEVFFLSLHFTVYSLLLTHCYQLYKL